MSATITAAIPCFNAAPFLAEAIESVLAQTRPAVEVIVVDDGSTDGSGAIAARYDVKLVTLPDNLGHATARNAALRAAQGEYVAWLDADDTWLPHHLEVVGGLLDRFPEAAVAYGAAQLVGERSDVWDDFPCHHQPRSMLWECFRRTIVPAMSAVARKAALDEVGGFEESIRVAPDFDLWLRLAARYPFVSTPQVTVNYRWHPGQISRNPLEQLRSIYQTRRRFIDRLLEQGDRELAGEASARLRAIYQEQLRSAWRRGDGRCLRSLLALHETVPGSDDTVRRWRARAWVPGILVWGVRRAVGGLRRAWQAVVA